MSIYKQIQLTQFVINQKKGEGSLRTVGRWRLRIYKLVLCALRVFLRICGSEQRKGFREHQLMGGEEMCDSVISKGGGVCGLT